MAATSPYSTRLDSDRIRLLTLLPGSWSSPLRCTLSTFPLNAAPSYHALSYVWGDEDSPESIELNGIARSLTKNLDIALRFLRSENSPSTLWIDALCINQPDIEELNCQVSIMGSIYAKAAQVLIWIGEEDALNRPVFDAMVAIEKGSSFEEATQDTYVSQFHMAYISDLPWFHRVWTMQEMALATADPLVICGRKAVRWRTFYTTWQAAVGNLTNTFGITGTSSLNQEYFNGTRLDALDGLRKEVQTNCGQLFWQAYSLSRKCTAKEPRDRVYALLPLLTPEDRADFTIDYAKPIEVVFAEAMAHVFRKCNGPYFLSLLRLRGRRTAMPNLPSWVPDLTVQSRDRDEDGYGGYKRFHPASPQSAAGKYANTKNGMVLRHFKTLKIDVLIVDNIRHVLTFDINIHRCIQQLHEAEALNNKAATSSNLHEDPTHRFYSERRQSESLWRILISNKKFISGSTAPDDYERQYQALLRHYDAQDAEKNEYFLALNEGLPTSTLFVTSKYGLVGVGHPDIRPGDVATIWFGAPVVFILRPVRESTDENHYQIVASAYVGGIMGGEVVDELHEMGLLESKTVCIL